MSAAFLVVLLLTFGCSGEEDKTSGTGSTKFPSRTLAAAPESPSSTVSTPASGITTGVTSGTTGQSPGTTLRLEGDAGTSFSGICTTGAEEEVLIGQVPKSYSFDLQGRTLSCQIKKQSPDAGSLRTVLLAGDATRSIQQTRAQESIINISYSGG